MNYENPVLSGYKYAPHAQETKDLCDKLQTSLPDVRFRFTLDEDLRLRIRAIGQVGDKEMLLRAQSSDEVVESFTRFFGGCRTGE